MKKTGLKRDIIDKFYTNEKVVSDCVEYFKQYIQIDKENDIILEPSAGNGAFIKSIETICDNYIFLDIEPENPKITKADFLDFKGECRNYHTIGNPPFGRQCSMAIKFIKKACEFSKSISFILPKSFKKQSTIKCFSLDFHLIFSIDLDKDSFCVDGNAHDVPCVFQIWERKCSERKVAEKQSPINFEFVQKEDEPDISFRRVGANAGTICFGEEINEKNKQSHYFIKFKNGVSVEKLENLSFEKDNTTGPRSISKQELIKEFNKFL